MDSNMEDEALDDFLVEKPTAKRTNKEVFRWWESRRLRYNLICLVVGILSMLFIESQIHLFREAGRLYFIISGITFLAGNLFYFLGFLIEIMTSRNEKIGPILFAVILGITLLALLFPAGLAFVIR